MNDVATRAEEIVEKLFLTPEGRSDPYPLYHALRETAPVHYSPALESWFISRYADVAAIVREEPQRLHPANVDVDRHGTFADDVGAEDLLGVAQVALFQQRIDLERAPVVGRSMTRPKGGIAARVLRSGQRQLTHRCGRLGRFDKGDGIDHRASLVERQLGVLCAAQDSGECGGRVQTPGEGEPG